MKKTFYEQVKDAIKHGVLIEKIILLLFIRLRFSNDHLFPVELRYKIYNKLEKRYFKLIENDRDERILKATEPYKVIWFCWLQGLEQAPPIVQRCYESMVKHTEGWEIKLITSENLFEYISFPEYILDKWKRGIITNTHMSDIIRLQLLIKYGGLWVDSTVFFTGEIPKYVYENNFFTYHHSYRYDLAIEFESWFIYSIPSHPLLIATQKMLFEYWKKEKKLNDYFLFHLFFTLATKKYPNLWEDVPFFTDITPHNLYYEIYNTYNEKRYNQIIGQTSIHKLTYKLDSIMDIRETYLDKILKGDLS